MSTEKRIINACELRVGAALGGNSGGDEMAIEGYAARFNSPSKDLGGFRETIAPGAFTRALAEKQDVYCLLNHDSSKILGRVKSGTLALSQDDKGLWFRCMLDPKQQSHRDVHAAIARHDLDECSFAFTPNGETGDHWEDRQDENGKYFISRTLKDVNLFDCSVVAHPAYNNTDVAARAEQLPIEVRNKMSEIVKKRAAKVGGI